MALVNDLGWNNGITTQALYERARRNAEDRIKRAAEIRVSPYKPVNIAVSPAGHIIPARNNLDEATSIVCKRHHISMTSSTSMYSKAIELRCTFKGQMYGLSVLQEETSRPVDELVEKLEKWLGLVGFKVKEDLGKWAI